MTRSALTTEAALRHAQERLRLAASAGNIGVWDWDLATDRVYFSPEWKAQLGYEEHEIGDDFSEWQSRVHPDDVASAEDSVRRFLANPWPDFRLEYRFRHKDGSYRWILAQAAVLRNAAGEPERMLGCHIDITERKRGEETLHQGEARFRTLLESLPQLVWTYSPDGRCDWVSPQWVRYCGRPAGEHLGREWVEQLHPDDRERVRDRLIASERNGGPFDAEFRIRRHDGAHRLFSARGLPMPDGAGRVVRWLASSADIEDFRQAQAALQEREEQLRLYAEHAPAAIAMLDRDMRYLVVSRRWMADYGLGDQSILGRSHYDVFPELPRRWVEVHRRCLAGAVEGCDEDSFVRADGTTDWLRWQIRPWHRADGEIGGVIVMTEDISERKRAEEGLRRERETLLRISESSPVGIAMTNRDGDIVFANARAEKILGLTRDEITQRAYNAPAWRITDYAGGPFPEAGLPFERVRASGRGVHDIRHAIEFPDGRRVLLSINAAPLLKGDAFDGMVATFDDVTERVQAAEALVAADRRRASILEAISDAFVALDRDWRYTYVNQRAAELFGRRAEALVGKHIWTEFPEGVGQNFYHAYQKAMSEGVTVRLEEYYPPWDRWYENRIYPSEGGLAIYFTEITERKRAEALLVGQKRVLEMIAAGAPLRDTLEALLRIVEAQSGEMLSSTLLLDEDGVHVRHGAAPRLPESFTAAIDGSPIGERAGSCGTAAYRREAVIVEDIASDPLWEDYRDLAASHGLRACWSTPIFDAERSVLGTFALYFREPGRPTDHHLRLIDMATHTAAIAITRKREEERLRASEARYRELNAELEQRVAARTSELNARTRELETFAYSVSHDLKAPLRGIDGYSRLLLQEHAASLDEEGRSFLHTIRQATGQMGQLIDDLLAYSRLERRQVQMGRVDLRSLVAGLVADRASEVQARGTVVSGDVPDAVILGDREGLAIALRNLLENALKFTRDVPVPAIEIGGRLSDSACLLWVRDNGIGFDMKFHDRIFDVFQRLQRSEDYPGTGVGLAMVRRALERMGGRVWAESEPGKGATFFLEVPRQP